MSNTKNRRKILQNRLYATVIYNGIFERMAINDKMICNNLVQATNYSSSSEKTLTDGLDQQHYNKYHHRRRHKHYYSHNQFFRRSSSDSTAKNSISSILPSNSDKLDSKDESAAPLPTDNSEETKAKVNEDPKIITVDSKHQQFQWQNKTYSFTPSDSDNENFDAYRLIAMKQAEASKKSRDATTANVRRALYGNVAICCAKLGAWMSCGSSAMLSEFVHSLVDCGNQGLLLIGLRESAKLQ